MLKLLFGCVVGAGDDVGDTVGDDMTAFLL